MAMPGVRFPEWIRWRSGGSGACRHGKAACEEANPEIQAFVGRVVTGDQFVAERSVKNEIASWTEGYCTEMEGAAIAQTAYLNKVPFVIVRAISDKADDSASVDYPTFEAQAIEHSVKLIENFVSRLPEDATKTS